MTSDKAADRANAGPEGEGTPLARTLGRHPLVSMTDIRNEMARVYRAVVTSKVDAKKGQGLVYVLGQIGRMTEGADLEKRIADLERRMKGDV